MFNTVSRARGSKRQEEERPEPGVDSTYGVRSLGDSDFGSGLLGRVPQGLDEEAEEVVEDVRDEEATGPVAQEWTPTSNTDRLPTHEISREADIEASPSSPLLTSPNSPSNLPSQLEGYYRHTIPTPDDLSEPSSPASFASMPSYISSSLSRTSSLGPDGHRSGNYQYQYQYGMGGSEELVIPTLNVETGPTSTGSGSGGLRYLGRHPTHEGDGGRGIKVMLLGNEEQVGIFLSSLRGWNEVVDLQEGRWGIVGDDLVTTTLSTGLSANEVETRIENAYTTLNGALHPDPSPELRDQVQDLAAGYAIKSDWVHLVISLDQDPSSIAPLADIVPTITVPDQTRSPPTTKSPLMSPHAIPDPTPRPGVEGLSYFADHEPHTSSFVNDLVAELINTLQYPDQVQVASTAKFLAWRQSRRDLASSHTSHSHSHSHSHESSASGEVAPMPTLARAQGGGEWEANLSRRLAQRRQSQSQSGSHSDQPSSTKRGRRRGSTATSRPVKPKGLPKGKENCGPLFPSSNTGAQGEGLPSGKGIAGVGVLGELVEKTFGGLRRRWKWGLVAAAAVALVVGWNWNWDMSVRLSTCIS